MSLLIERMKQIAAGGHPRREELLTAAQLLETAIDDWTPAWVGMCLNHARRLMREIGQWPIYPRDL
jgi:hypothetical protein